MFGKKKEHRAVVELGVEKEDAPKTVWFEPWGMPFTIQPGMTHVSPESAAYWALRFERADTIQAYIEGSRWTALSVEESPVDANAWRMVCTY